MNFLVSFHKYLILGMKLAYFVFSITDDLSQTLQSAQLSCADGSQMAEAVIRKLQDCREETKFGTFYQEVKEEADNLGILLKIVSEVLLSFYEP